MWFWLNGGFVEDEDAKVSVTDRGFLYGDGCYESVGVWKGRLLHLDEHVERLYRSAKMLRIALPLEPTDLRDVLLQTAARNGMDVSEGGYLRPVVSRGGGPLGLGNSHLAGPTTLVIIPAPGVPGAEGSLSAPPRVLRAAISSHTRAWSSTFDPRIKTLNYLPSVLAALEAKQRGADVGILRNVNGYIAETSGTNIFCVRDEELLVPAEADALAGVTRGNVIHVARQLGYDVRERNLTAYDLCCSDEVFVTAASVGLHAIGSVDGIDLAQPLPGPVTTRLRSAYLDAAFAHGAPVPASVSAS
jgi:branched-chain amino acid aminotransferase